MRYRQDKTQERQRSKERREEKARTNLDQRPVKATRRRKFDDRPEILGWRRSDGNLSKTYDVEFGFQAEFTKFGESLHLRGSANLDLIKKRMRFINLTR